MNRTVGIEEEDVLVRVLAIAPHLPKPGKCGPHFEALAGFTAALHRILGIQPSWPFVGLPCPKDYSWIKPCGFQTAPLPSAPFA